MPREDAFRVEGVVIAALSDRTGRVELANGHQLLGFMTRKVRATLGAPRCGQKVILQVTPYDLSAGRIIGANEKVET